MSDVADRPASTTTMTADTMIQKYVQLRDLKKAREDRFKQELAPINDMMTKLEGYMLEALNAANLSSMRSPHGTAFKSLRTSAKVLDWAATLGFIREHDAWDLLEARVAKKAAFDIVEETQQAIPGVETTSEVCVNVRRAADSGK